LVLQHQAVRLLAVAGLAVALLGGPASAQFAGNSDGFAPDGTPRMQVELSPYVWLPDSNVKISLGPRGNINGDLISGGVDTGVPNSTSLNDTLHPSFMGLGLLRYGPWSAELDLDWVSASGTKEVIGPLGNWRGLTSSVTLFRTAPGVGYEVFKGEVGGIPVTADARVGFAVFSWTEKLTSEIFPTGVNTNGTFVQPWLGTRVSFYPGTDWRIEIGALGQGFGVDNGSWGWGASAMVAYSVTSRMDVTGGFRAINTSRNNPGALGVETRKLDVTSYGPLVGVGFRF